MVLSAFSHSIWWRPWVCHIYLYYVEALWFLFFYLNHEQILHFSKCFICIHWADHMILFFTVDVMYYVYWFADVEPSLYIQLDHYVWFFLRVVGIDMLGLVEKFLHLCSSGVLVHNFLFYCVLVWFSDNGNVGLTERVWEISFSFNFLE